MPYPVDITYPTAATNATWQSKKSKLDKLGATGVGPLLTAAEAAWNKIKFSDLDDKYTSTDLKAAKQRLVAGQAALVQVAAARKALAAAITKADAQSKNNKLNSTSTKALTNIVTALKAADHRLDLMDDLTQAIQIDIHNLELQGRAQLKGAVKGGPVVGVKGPSKPKRPGSA
jgi:hypothetical protein